MFSCAKNDGSTVGSSRKLRSDTCPECASRIASRRDGLTTSPGHTSLTGRIRTRTVGPITCTSPPSGCSRNARTHLVNNGAISDGLAPSYFIEGLLYNVPDIEFGSSYELSFGNCLKRS